MLRRSLLDELGPRSGFDAASPRRPSRGTTRMQMLEATMAFVQEHNPAD